MINCLRVSVLVVGSLGLAMSLVAKEPAPPSGVLAASCGDEVVLLDPAGGWASRFDSGPVGWLFPAPGGMLFAPDLVHGRTAVIDVRLRKVRERFEGVSMPHFGLSADRYLVAGPQVLLVSYPERAPIVRVDADIQYPWQVHLTEDQGVALILERHPEGQGPSTLVAVDLVHREVVLRHRLGGDVVSMAVPPGLGMVALADRVGRMVHLIEPASVSVVAGYPVSGAPRDIVFIPDSKLLAVAVAGNDSSGEILLWRIKSGRKGLTRKEMDPVPLSGAPVRLAVSPLQDYLAVSLTSAAIEVVELKRATSAGVIDLPVPARDIVWCDPDRPGPMLPEWSDEQPPGLDLGG